MKSVTLFTFKYKPAFKKWVSGMASCRSLFSVPVLPEGDVEMTIISLKALIWISLPHSGNIYEVKSLAEDILTFFWSNVSYFKMTDERYFATKGIDFPLQQSQYNSGWRSCAYTSTSVYVYVYICVYFNYLWREAFIYMFIYKHAEEYDLDNIFFLRFHSSIYIIIQESTLFLL